MSGKVPLLELGTWEFGKKRWKMWFLLSFLILLKILSLRCFGNNLRLWRVMSATFLWKQLVQKNSDLWVTDQNIPKIEEKFDLYDIVASRSLCTTLLRPRFSDYGISIFVSMHLICRYFLLITRIVSKTHYKQYQTIFFKLSTTYPLN